MAMIKYFSSNDTNDKNNISLRNVIFSVLTAYLLLISGIFIVSLITIYSNLSVKSADAIVKIIYFFSFFVCGFLASLKRKNRGWFCGLVASAVYFALIMVTVFSISSQAFSLDIILKLIPALMIGIVGGIFGVNKKKKKRR